MYKCQHFLIKELVSPIVYNTWGEKAWMFFDPDALKDIDTIRETYGSPIIINNWGMGLKQCGLRSNLDEMVLKKTKQGQLYLSSHTRGCAFDLHCYYGHNDKLWQHCSKLIKYKKLKALNRIENYESTSNKGVIQWVHVDRMNDDSFIF